ncbi:MAG: hypothetical protein PHH71_01605 [Clostridia bacterium]|jgi:hypothetical protein|nr:hypothetical protein [Clostridia bacterium]MDD3232278.1 hypothetical protein [Clostridia bacterium]MDD3862455.1 hypothetical protein [Clostridia bacterium]MDD4408396.1 hypothetical protein [Clostridia bacterium]
MVRGIGTGLFTQIFQEMLIYRRADRIAANPEKCEKSKGMGITSIIFSILAILLAAGAPFLSYYIIIASLTTNLLIIGNIFFFAFGLLILIIPFYLARYAVVFSRAQRRINTLKIGKVSRILSWIATIASIIILVIIVLYLIALGK